MIETFCMSYPRWRSERLKFSISVDVRLVCFSAERFHGLDSFGRSSELRSAIKDAMRDFESSLLK